MNKIKQIISVVAVCLLAMTAAAAFAAPANASEPTDEILDYIITVDVNSDGTLKMDYRIWWKVLESDSLGPLTWVSIGIPNGNVTESYGVSDNIEDITISGSGGYYADVYLEDKYYKDEVAEFEFVLVQDYMYTTDGSTGGNAYYSFTPGWFDEIAVDNLTIRWNSDKAESWEPNCLNKDGYLTWTTALDAGATYTVSVTYPANAYAFDTSSEYNDNYYSNNGDYYSGDDGGGVIAGIIFLLILLGFIPGIIFLFYVAGGGFRKKQQTTTKKKIKRTLIKYYPTCQGCGAVRKEGQKFCEYCGRSFVESEEVIEENEVEDAGKYDKEGEYHYSSDPNVFINVHVTDVIVPIARAAARAAASSFFGGGGFRGGGGGSHGGGGCACASSCACACACACAGGGRAGCSTKDFYNTNLKLKQLELKAKKTQAEASQHN